MMHECDMVDGHELIVCVSKMEVWAYVGGEEGRARLDTHSYADT